MPILGWKTGDHLHDVAAGMREAVADDHLERLRQIAREQITHLIRRLEMRRSLGQDPREVLSGMATLCDKQRNPMAITGRHDAQSEDAGAIGGDVVGIASLRVRALERQHGQACIVVVNDFPRWRPAASAP